MAASALQQLQAHLRHALAELLQAQPVPQQRAVQHCKDKHREKQRVAHGGGHIKAALGAWRAGANHHRVNAAKNANGSESKRHAGKRDHAVHCRKARAALRVFYALPQKQVSRVQQPGDGCGRKAGSL